MNQALLRITLLSLWSASFLICIAGLVALPRWRSAIGAEQVIDAIKSVTAIWLPVLTCLTTFWFGGHETRQRGQNLIVAAEQWVPAISITAMYVILITVMIFWIGYGIDYSSPEFSLESLSVASSFNGKINAVLQWAGMLSPFGTAPAIWLSGKGVSKATARNTARARP
jgi:hypothetical protein